MEVEYSWGVLKFMFMEVSDKTYKLKADSIRILISLKALGINKHITVIADPQISKV